MKLTANLKKFDDELQIVYGEVYCPDVTDSQGEFMTQTEVRKMAHKFLINMYIDRVDTNHDNVINKSMVVESFISRASDPDFLENSWVVGVWIPEVEIWKKVKSGELNGFSFEAMARSEESILEVDVPEAVEGSTNIVEGHSHKFIVFFDEQSVLLGGYTDSVNGHSHDINSGTVTENTAEHTHRYSFTEGLVSE